MSVNVTAKTKIAGIYGYPIEHTLSPRMHNAAFKTLGMDIIYLPFEVKRDSLREAMKAIKMLNFIGVNVTHPHKTAALEHLDDLTDEAKRIGAVNTVVNRSGRLVGHNTDGVGFIRSLREDYGFDPKDKRIIVFGAGGAGRAICSALSQEGPERMMIVNRTLDKAEVLAEKVGGAALGWDTPKLKQEISEAQLLVNATSSFLNLDHECISERLFIYDIVYNHRRNAFVQRAQQKGARIADGLSMLLYQGALAFELWTGQKAPLEVMRGALHKSEK